MTVSIDATLEALVRRDRQVVIAALTIVIALSWGYLLVGAGMPMMTPVSWTLGYAVLMFFMWWIMMLAMMLPSAAPMVLLFATVNRKQRETSHPYVATSVFALGYLAAWVGFSLVAVMLQWGFERTHLLSSPLVGANVILGGVLLFAAGVYQLTPIKHACLGHCRCRAVDRDPWKALPGTGPPSEDRYQLFDDSGSFGLKLHRVLTILDADEPPGITDTFLELVVPYHCRGFAQPVRRIPLVGSGDARQPVDLAFQVGDLDLHRFLAFQ